MLITTCCSQNVYCFYLREKLGLGIRIFMVSLVPVVLEAKVT